VKLFEIFGDVVLKGGKEAEKDIDNLDKKGGSLGATLGAVGKGAMVAGGLVLGAAAAIGKMATSAAETVDRVDKLSQKIGLTKTGFQEWDYVLGQNGIQIDVLQGGVKTLTNKIDELSKGGKGATEAFEALGLSYDDIQGKSQEEVFNMTIEALQGMEDTTKRAAIATDLLGRSGTELAPLLNQTAEATNNLKNRSHELGLVMSDEAVGAGVLLADTIDDVKKTFGAFATQIGVQVMPIIQMFLEWILQNMPVIQSTFKTVFGVIRDVIKVVYDFFMANFMPILSVFFDWIQTNMPVIQATAKTVFETFLEVVTTLWDFYVKNLLPIQKAFVEFVIANMPLIQSIIESVFGAIWVAVELVWNVFKNVLLPVLQALWDFISPTFPLIQAVVETVFGAIAKQVETVSTIFQTLIGWVSSAIDWISRFNSTQIEEKKTGGFGGISQDLKAYTKRALGGPVNAGQTYLVGERGPETVTFGRSGMVTPNNALGGQGINVTINNPVVTDKRFVDEMGKQLVGTLRAKGLVTT
jgi:hypothetical protein